MLIINKFVLCVVFYILLLSCGNSSKTTQKDQIISDLVVDSENLGFTIPFEIINGRMVISTMLNGVIYVRLAVDNGVDELHLIEEFAQKYGDSLEIVLYPNVAAMGAFISAPMQKSYVASGKFYYRFGDSIFVNYNKSCYVINGEYTEDFACILKGGEVVQSLPDRVMGIIPLRSFSKNGILKINFKDKRLEFPETVDSSAVSYKVDDANRTINLPIEFVGESGSKSYLFSSILDLGYYGDLLIFGNKKVSKIMGSIPKDYQLDVDYDEYGRNYIYYRSMMIGKDSVIFNNMGVLYLKNINELADAVIGVELMSKYDMFFDYRNNYIYMRSLESKYDMINRQFSITVGMGIRTVNVNNNPKRVVSMVLNDYKKVDVRCGDTILKIDYLELESIGRDSLKKIFADRTIPNKTVTVKRGDKVVVLSRNK